MRRDLLLLVGPTSFTEMQVKGNLIMKFDLKEFVVFLPCCLASVKILLEVHV